MKHYLYKFSDNWADEMDLEGFAVLTETEKDMALAKIRKQYKKGGTLCFGTNEDNEYDSLQDIINCISFKEISKSEYTTIKKVFGSNSMGEIGPLDSEFCSDEEEEDDERCIDCGGRLDNDYSDYCTDCDDEEDDDYEEEFERRADLVTDFLKNEYSLEESETNHYYSRFVWKPTPKSEIEITIQNFDDGEEEMELTLKFNGRDLQYEFYQIENAENTDFFPTMRKLISEYVEKAKKHQ